MWQRLRDFWRAHQQETLGWCEACAGMLEYVDSSTINLVGGFFGPTYGPMVSKVIQVAAGLRIAYRARQVSRRA